MPVSAVRIDCLEWEDAHKPWEQLNTLVYRHDVFQSHAWAGFEQFVNGNRAYFLLVYGGKDLLGGQVVLRRPLFQLLHGYETAGGPLFVEGYEEKVCKAVVGYVAELMPRAVYQSLRPTAGHNLHAVLTEMGFRSSQLETIVLETSRPEQELWKALDGNARTGIKKGRKSGVEVVEATDWKQWQAFAAVHAQHAREKSTSAMSQTALQYLYHHLLPAGQCRLLLGMIDNRCVSGMLFLVCQEQMLFYLGASDGHYLDASPNDPLMWEAIRWACHNDIKQFDLYDTDSRETSPLYGIHRFKSKWGGTLVQRPFYVKGQLYFWARERLRNEGWIRRIANHLKRGRLA